MTVKFISLKYVIKLTMFTISIENVVKEGKKRRQT